ncbi:hypothetical protein ILUMI_00664, partial [Ignelater luminosus]
ILDMNVHPELHCIKCKNLLSKSPIVFDNNGDNICGRCKKDDNIYLCNTYYEMLAHQFNFPCRYYKEGCYIKDLFNDIGLHEENCPYQLKRCPVKACLWSGTTAELIIHYDVVHPKLKMNNDCVKILGHAEGCNILTTHEFYFLIEWICQDSSLKVRINSLDFVKPQDDVEFVCCLMTSELNNHSKVSTCLELKKFVTLNLYDIQKTMLDASTTISVKITLPINLINRRLEELDKIKCPCCQLYMTPPILKCPENHITCLNCTGADYNFCVKCVEDELNFTRVKELEIITVSFIYTCKWKDCGARFTYKEIQAHEQNCCKRIFMCLHCYDWYSTLNELIPHDMVCPSKRYLWPMLLNTQVTAFGKDIGTFNYTLVAYKEIFHVTIQFTKENKVNMSVSNYGPFSCFDWYRYEADLEHIENKNFPFNKTFDINNKRYSEYSLSLFDDVMNNFDGLRFCKITIRIVLLDNSERNINIERSLRGFNF